MKVMLTRENTLFILSCLTDLGLLLNEQNVHTTRHRQTPLLIYGIERLH